MFKSLFCRRKHRFFSSKNYIIISLLSSLLFGSFSYAQDLPTSPPSMTLGYQGELYDAAQNPLEGSWTLHFRLYTVESNGEHVWQETHSDVLIEKGRFSVQLGQEITFPSDLINENQLFLGIQVDEGQELTPRLKVGATFQAHWAQQATTATISDHALDVSGEHIHPATLTIGDTLVIDEAGRWVGPPLGETAIDLSLVVASIREDLSFRESIIQYLIENHSTDLQYKLIFQ